MKVPVVLPLVQVNVSEGGSLEVTLERMPYATDRRLAPNDLPAVLDEITTTLASPVRVELTEPDGSMLVDIATPPADPAVQSPSTSAGEPQRSGLHGFGFRPGERIAVAYVVLHETADADGVASIQLPPALLGRAGLSMLLHGHDSQVTIEMTA